MQSGSIENLTTVSRDEWELDLDLRISETHESSNARTRSLVLLVSIWFVTQFVGIFSPPLMDDVDSIHIEAAREMASRHDYVTLYADGIRYLDKPPLPYWLGAAGIQLFGVHDWAVRLPLALSVLVLILYLYGMGARLFGERAGFYSACVFATAIGPYIFTRFFIPDVIVALWMTIAADLILRMVRSIEEEGSANPLHAALFGLVCTCGVLTKGLIGIVFPLGLLLLYLLATSRVQYLLKMRPLLGAGTFLLTALPWHILAAVENQASGQWVWFYFVNEQIDRYLNKRVPHDYNTVPLLLFWLLLIVWIMPWGIFLACAVRDWVRNLRPLRFAGPRLLFVLWALLIVGFFSFSTRQEYYTLPAIPALALLLGSWLAKENASGDARGSTWMRASSGVLLFIGLVVAVACAYFAIAAHTPPAGAELYEELAKHPQDYTLSTGHLLDLTATAFGFFRLPLAGMAVSMLGMTALSFWFRVKGKLYASNLTLAIGMCAVLACVHMGLTVFYPILGSEPLAKAIRSQWKAGDKVVLDGEYSSGSSINFYLGEPVYMLNGRVNNLWYGSLYADAPHRFETTDSFLRLWQGPGRVFFVTYDAARTADWQREHGGALIASSSGKFVLLNRAQ